MVRDRPLAGRCICPYCCDDTPITGGRGFCTTSTSLDFLVFGTCRGAQEGTEKDEVISTCSKTADGNVVLTGLTQGDWVETNTGLWALVAVKLDVADGSVIWRYQVGEGGGRGMAWCTLLVTGGRLVRHVQSCLIGCAWLRK